MPGGLDEEDVEGDQAGAGQRDEKEQVAPCEPYPWQAHPANDQQEDDRGERVTQRLSEQHGILRDGGGHGG
ncbi:hypothetical protein [Microbacterium sp. NPDC056234]|uniref:hypothetical protein n=1 Tax=Microbacterium sp. NPDC056234 TaxID=3345757 RepID=UPI0035D70885